MAEPRVLEVWFDGARAGTLVDDPAGVRFAYAAEWVARGGVAVSHALPVGGPHAEGAAAAFFGGLLPEERPRRELARRVGVSVGNDFSLLEQIAGDTAGAVSLHRPGRGPGTAATRTDEARTGDARALPDTPPPTAAAGPDAPPSAAGEVTWLDEAELRRTLEDLPQRPMHVDADGTWRLSLAGAQDKLPVVVRDGRIGLTHGREPSTHIIKTPIERVHDSVVNEAFCLRFAAALGIAAVDAWPRTADGREYLLVRRYDRAEVDGRTRRIHQEDVCQALGIPADRKYEAEGGPTHDDCFRLVRQTATAPARDVTQVAGLALVNYLVGNHDAHGKNLSLIRRVDPPAVLVAPAYDVLSTAVYNRRYDLSRKMAMRFGGEYRPEYVTARHLDRFLEGAGLRGARARRFVARHADGAAAAAATVREGLRIEGWDRPLLGEIEALIAERATRLGAAAAG